MGCRTWRGNSYYGCLWRGESCYGCLWQTSAMDCSSRRCLPWLVRTYAVTMICGTLSNMHTTYPLCGWTRSKLAMHVTRSVSRMGIIVRGRFSVGMVLASRYHKWEGESLTTPGQPLARTGWCLGVSRVIPGWRRGEWV